MNVINEKIPNINTNLRLPFDRLRLPFDRLRERLIFCFVLRINNKVAQFLIN